MTGLVWLTQSRHDVYGGSHYETELGLDLGLELGLGICSIYCSGHTQRSHVQFDPVLWSHVQFDPVLSSLIQFDPV